jgi:GTP-binding protein Era
VTIKDSNETQEQKFGFVAVIGEPNAGKSTLINNIVGTKVSIVSPKVQTTRTRVLGIAIEENAQIVFVDTPGIFNASQKNKMERAIVASAWEGIANAEIILLLVDASKKIGESTKIILDRLKKEEQNKTGKRFILVLNKIDRIRRDLLLDLSSGLNAEYDFEATFMLSALKGNGVKDLLEYLAKKLPEGQWHFPEDQVTDMPMRLMAAEVTREKLFKMMHQELPYQLTVETEDWEPFNDGSIKINQTIFITREAHKKIILGKGGLMIKKIGQIAREELEDILETRVHLKLFVKVRENWLDDEERYAMWGLDLNA